MEKTQQEIPTDAVARAAEVLGVHEVVFIDHEVGYECGCNEGGDGHPEGLPAQRDALLHQAQSLADAGLLVRRDIAVEVRAKTGNATSASVSIDGRPASNSVDFTAYLGAKPAPKTR